MQRRTFIQSAVGGTVLSLLPGFAKATALHESKFTSKKIKPKRLKPGDTIALIAPGFAVSEDKLEAAKKYIKDLGFVPYHTHRILGNEGYFSNTDKERLADLHEAFENKNVAGIICARGGYGCTRILSDIDYNLIKNNPKVLMGYSDITALLNAIYQETGLITFHGPVASAFKTPFEIENFTKIITTPKKQTQLSIYTEDSALYTENPEFERYTIVPGEASGELAGGNLSLLAAMAGTPYEVALENKIVFLEDIEEQPYRIDRMLTQLIETGKLAKAKAIVLGIFKGCNHSSNPLSYTLKQVLLDRIKPLGIPAAYGFSIGHIENQITLPVGAKATVNTNNLTITINETAVT